MTKTLNGAPTQSVSAYYPDKLVQLRQQHSTLRYESCCISEKSDGGLSLTYRFSLLPGFEFSTSVEIPSLLRPIDETTTRLAFLIGMVELVSYWKLCCPERIEVIAGHLTSDELIFWENLIRQGLGEFFYLNRIPPTINFEIISTAPEWPLPNETSSPTLPPDDSWLVMVGGGKDSIVTLQLLAHLDNPGSKLSSIVVNPIDASIAAIKQAGYPKPLTVRRSLDPKLKDLNARGYLNGHTPFSALLAFVSTLVAYRNNYRYVLASNESSASEGNVEYHGVQVNHQYSKSWEFEKLFTNYISKLGIPIQYLSFLRPINELQICSIFSGFPEQHLIFRSCNQEQTQLARARAIDNDAAPKRRGWCAECPKCIFTYLCLMCFVPHDKILQIFGADPANSPNFIRIVRELAGLSIHKPFECVGTFEEVRACLNYIFLQPELRRLIQDAYQAIGPELAGINVPESNPPLQSMLNRWSSENKLNERLTKLLKDSLQNRLLEAQH